MSLASSSCQLSGADKKTSAGPVGSIKGWRSCDRSGHSAVAPDGPISRPLGFGLGSGWAVLLRAKWGEIFPTIWPTWPPAELLLAAPDHPHHFGRPLWPPSSPGMRPLDPWAHSARAKRPSARSHLRGSRVTSGGGPKRRRRCRCGAVQSKAKRAERPVRRTVCRCALLCCAGPAQHTVLTVGPQPKVPCRAPSGATKIG